MAGGLRIPGRRADQGKTKAAAVAPQAIPTSRAVSDPDFGIRTAARALDYLATLVPSTISWCARAGPDAKPDLGCPVVVRPGPGAEVDPDALLDDYRWLGVANDPFQVRPDRDPGDVVRGVDHFGGAPEFSAMPFAERFLARHSLTSRTVIYLRDRGPVFATVALDRGNGEPAPDARETVLLVRVAPFLSQALAAGFFPETGSPGPVSLPGPVAIAGLTQREKQVARMVERGLSNGEIATELAISRSTVKAHLGQLYRKAGVRTRARLLALLLGREGGA